jgi:peptidoglycan/LPS O-acetylase OafA/YrhL
MANQMEARAPAECTEPEGRSGSAATAPARTEQRIDGIQWLRAILSVFVVVWHLGGAGKTGLWDDRYLQHRVEVADILSFQVLLLAVPGFMLISNYLLAAAHPTGEIAWKRTQRVIVLLLFWPLALTLFQTGWGGVVAEWPKTGDQAIVYVLTAGYTIFYFFVSLLLTYGVTLLVMNLSTPVNIALLAVSTAIVAAAPLGAVAYRDPHLAAYWSPLNFLPYSFAGLVVLRLFGPDSDRSRATSVALAMVAVGIAIAVGEWQYYRHGLFHATEQVSYPTYTRASLVFHATALLILMIHWAPRAPAIVEFMAKHSLALYCLHLFMAEPLRALVKHMAPALPTLTQAWIVIPLAIVASYITSRILMQVWRERLLF